MSKMCKSNKDLSLGRILCIVSILALVIVITQTAYAQVFMSSKPVSSHLLGKARYIPLVLPEPVNPLVEGYPIKHLMIFALMLVALRLEKLNFKLKGKDSI